MASNSKKDKVTWTREMNIDLVQYMENHPNIWDPNHPKFSNLGFRDETFARYAADRDVDWQAVKHRWTNIRTTFGFYMRKLEARKKIGRDFKVGWFLWRPCKYLYAVHRLKPPTKSSEKSSEEDKADPTNDDDMSNDAISSDNGDNSQSISETADNISCEGIINNLSAVLEAVKNDAYDTDNSRTRHAAVGEAVTSMLSQLDSYDAAQMTQKILEILAEYDEKNPMNPNGLRYDTE